MQDNMTLNLDQVREKARLIMEATHTAGMAVGIVYKGKILMEEGYAQAHLVTNKPVTAETRFMIGSNTKSIIGLLTKILSERGHIDLHRPIRAYVPEAVFKDATANVQVTLDDLLKHQVGLPRHDHSWAGRRKNLNNRDILDMLQYLEPNCAFRSRWQYSNHSYALAGIVMSRVMGKSLPQLLSDYIFQPLDMQEAIALEGIDIKDPQLSHSYLWSDIQRHLPMDHNAPAGMLGAGFVGASIRDMNRYLRYQISLSHQQWLKKDARNIDDKEFLTTFNTVFLCNHEVPLPVFYSHGLMISHYRNRPYILHGGGIAGFATAMGWLPEEQLGVIVLPNTIGGGPAAVVLSNMIFDLFLNAEPSPNQWSCLELMREQTQSLIRKKFIFKVQEDTTDQIVTDGDFHHKIFGSISIKKSSNKLEFKRDGVTGILHRSMGKIWQMEVTSGVESAFFLNNRCVVIDDSKILIDLNDMEVGGEGDLQSFTEFTP